MPHAEDGFVAAELSPEDWGWEYQNFYSLPPSVIRRMQLAKRTYELPAEMAGFGSAGSRGYLAGRSDSKAPKMSALWKTRVG